MKLSRWNTMAATSILVASVGLFASTSAHASADRPFFLHDGDTVVFYGDSITEQQMYPRDIETYVLTRFPKLHVKFINSGWSGDRVSGGGGGNIELRLKRDVFNYKPTVVTVFLGMNDGGYKKYDDSTFATYRNGLVHIVDSLKANLPGVRLTLLTPSYFDKNVKKWGDADYNNTLIVYSDFVKAYGAAHHIPVADENTPLSSAIIEGEKTDPAFAVSGDGVHPGDVGHLIMAASVLDAWGATDQLHDTILSEGQTKTITLPLPWPVPESAKQAFDVSYLPATLSQTRVTMAAPKGFKLGDTPAMYGLYVDGKLASTVPANSDGTVTADLGKIDDPAADAKSQSVFDLVQKRVTAWAAFWQNRRAGFVSPNDVPTTDELSKLSGENKSLDELRESARKEAQPISHTIALKRTS